MVADPAAKRRAAAFGRARTAVAVDREQALARSRSLRSKWRAIRAANLAGVSKGQLAEMADTTPNMIREWCAKAEADEAATARAKGRAK